MRKFSSLLLSTFLMIGAGCQNQQSVIPLSPKASENKMETTPEKPQESVTKTESPKPKPSTVPTDKDFRITNIAGWNPYDLGNPSAIFPVYAYSCDIYKIDNGLPLHYSKIDFFIAKDEQNASPILLGTTPGGSAGSGECDLDENESSLKSKLEPGKYRLWAVRYIDGKADKRTPDVLISIVNPN